MIFYHLPLATSCEFCFFLFFRAVLDTQQNQEEGTETSHRPPAITHAQSAYYQHPPPEWYAGYN